MSIWEIIRSLKYKQLKSLLAWFLKHPLFMIATISATVLTFRISQREFPDIHGKLNKANAFRHALWNVLIAKKCLRFSKDIKSVLCWTKKITDWHEEFSPNEELAKAMDLHNNQIGRNFFQELSQKKNNEIVIFMLSQLDEALKIKEVSDIDKTNQLMYIED